MGKLKIIKIRIGSRKCRVLESRKSKFGDEKYQDWKLGNVKMGNGKCLNWKAQKPSLVKRNVATYWKSERREFLIIGTNIHIGS